MSSTDSAAENKREEWTRYRPYALAGLIGPIVSASLTRWMPLHFAVAGTMFFAFAAASWLTQQNSVGSDRGSLWVSVVSGLAAGFVGGSLAFLFPWGQ